MKKLKLLTFAFLFFTIAVFAGSFNANADSRFNETFLELNMKQSEVAEEVEKIIVNDSYPSYFGGMYISDDSTHLVIQIVEENVPSTKDSKEYIGFERVKNIEGNIKYEYVKHSYKELNEINDKLIEYFSSDKLNLENLNAHYVDTFKNIIVVELLDNNLEQMDMFREKISSNDTFKSLDLKSDIIEVIQGKKHEDEAMKAGSNISVPGGSCSMGFRAKMNGKNGYITAAHCFSGIGDSSTGGTVTRYSYSGSVDAAFVTTTWWTNTFDAPSNDLQYTSGTITKLDNTVSPFLTVNGAIAKAGKTTLYTTGQIKNLNYSGTYNGTYFSGLIATNYTSSGGDSGGAVFVPSNINGGAPLAGIHKGTSSYGAAFVDAKKIYANFGYDRY